MEVQRQNIYSFLKKEFSRQVWQNILFLLHDTEFKGSYHVTAIDNQFVKQATMKEAHQLLKLDKDSMVETIVSECTL